MNKGSVYTKEWMVELILDLAGLDPKVDLVNELIIEPSCGEGAFAIPIVKRLMHSCIDFGHGFLEAKSSLRLVDTDARALSIAKNAIDGVLASFGINENDRRTLLDAWFVNDDYLLREPYKGVSFCIGNPPYVRSTDIEPSLKRSYLDSCRTMTAGSDLFVGFIEKGLLSLKEGGVLSFICADRWMHNSYGKKLRSMIASSDYFVKSIVVAHDADAFEHEVSAYPAITTIIKNTPCPSAIAFIGPRFKRNDAPNLVSDLNKQHPSHGDTSERIGSYEMGLLPQERITSDSWPIVTPRKLELLEYLEDNFPKLEESANGTRVGIGIATGNDSIYLTEDADIVEKSRATPIITARQLNANVTNPRPKYLINPWGEDGSLVDLEDYPRLKEYFIGHEEVVRKRAISKKNEDSWFRTIDKYHSGITYRPKLLIQDMHARFEPYYDDCHYPHGNLYYIVSDEWDLKVLGGLLMSDICELFIDAYGVKMRGGTLRFQAQFLRRIRVPEPSGISAEVKKRLSQAFLEKNYAKANKAAHQAFGLRDAV